jgi:hypothetical protein
MSQEQELIICDYNIRDLQIKLNHTETFETTFQKVLGHKKYDIAGCFFWNKNNPDGSLTCRKLKKTDSPSSVGMDIKYPQVLVWKQAVVLTLFKSS